MGLLTLDALKILQPLYLLLALPHSSRVASGAEQCHGDQVTGLPGRFRADPAARALCGFFPYAWNSRALRRTVRDRTPPNPAHRSRHGHPDLQ